MELSENITARVGVAISGNMQEHQEGFEEPHTIIIFIIEIRRTAGAIHEGDAVMAGIGEITI